MLKPNLVTFQIDEGQEFKSTVSVNCFDISFIKPKDSRLKENSKKTIIHFKNGNKINVIETVNEIHSQILKS